MKISPEIRDSIELRFSEIAREMNAKGERIISLGLGEPSFPTPSAIIKATHQAMLDGMTRYSNPLGLPSLCRRIAEKLETENKIEREKLANLVRQGNWVDAVRYKHDYDEKLFSWWSYRSKDWKVSNRGRRLDHIFSSSYLKNKIKKILIYKDLRDVTKPSDHVPITAEGTVFPFF